MPDLVSIVIVCHNNWPDLELAIESALQQTYQPLEVIVVDNDSNDLTPSEVPRRFGQRLRYIRQANRGDSGGYNTGMGVASGAFVQFLDGDDFLAPNKIEKQVELFRKEPDVDIVYGDMWQFQTPPGPPFLEDWGMREHPDMLLHLTASSGWMTPHGMLFRRRALELTGSWDEGLYICDVDYWMRAACKGCRFRYSPGALCFYRRRAGQMSTDTAAMLNGREQLWSKALQYVATEPHRSLVAAQLSQSRFDKAVRKTGMSTRQSLAHLRLARAGSDAISRTAFVLGAMVILVPGAQWLLKSAWLKPVRAFLSGLSGLRKTASDFASRN